MFVSELSASNLRCFETVRFRAEPGFNLIVGPNGSGKTSLLEAIHLLGTARSFRSHLARDLIRRGAKEVVVHGSLLSMEGEAFTVGVERGPGGLKVKSRGQWVASAAELARQLPLIVMTPDSVRLLTDGADLRRRLVDWLVFHVEPRFVEAARRYRRLIKQRNASLREARSDATAPWDVTVAEAGEHFAELRQLSLATLIPLIESESSRLLDVPVMTNYQRGWPDDKDLLASLRESVVDDRRRGFTQSGPHRADLRFSARGRPVQHALSRGESKLFVMALLIAQSRALITLGGRQPVLLVDDLASELDPDSRRRALTELSDLDVQMFLTAVPDHNLTAAETASMSTFHVEQGCLKEVYSSASNASTAE